MNQHDESFPSEQEEGGNDQSEQGPGGPDQVAPQAAPQGPEGSEPGEAAPNLIQRVIAVFTAPMKLGEQLRHASPWFWTLSIVVLISAVMLMLVPGEVLMKAALRADGSAVGDGPTPSVTAMRGLSVGGVILASFIGAALVAGVLYVTFNLIFGQSQITYKNQLSATAHVWWITLLGTLIVLPLQLAREDLQLKLGLGLVLPNEPSSFVGYFLNNITLFGVWASIALGGVESGLSEGKVSVGKAATTVLVLYLIMAVVGASFRTLTG